MKVNWQDKKNLNENPDIAEINKVTDRNMNELKHSINDLYDIVMNSIFGIGAIYSTTSEENPNDTFNFGVWEKWGEGRVPVGVDTKQEEFNAVEKIGGEKEHKLTIEEMPKHSHNFDQTNGDGARGNNRVGNYNSDYTVQTSEVGGSKPHNNLQPYITCYMWKRIS